MTVPHFQATPQAGARRNPPGSATSGTRIGANGVRGFTISPWWSSFLVAGLSFVPAAPVAQPALPELPSGVRLERDIPYVSDAHERQRMDIVWFTEGPPRPLVVWVHGGAFSGGDKAEVPQIWTGPLARDYAVASLNYRLSGDAKWPAPIQDCKAALRFLRAHAGKYNLDPACVGVWGSSAGGHLAAFLGTSGDTRQFDVGEHLDQSSAVQCVVNLFGPVDFLRMPRTNDINSPEGKLFGCAVVDCPEKAIEASPLTYLSANDPPFLIVHGDADKTISITQSEQLYAALQAAGVPATLITLPGVGHQRVKVWQLERERILNFFDQYLRPVEHGTASTIGFPPNRAERGIMRGETESSCAPLPRLRVSDNGRFLVTQQGEPFFWLGDTAWRLVQRSSRTATSNQPSLTVYFQKRREQGFNVIQIVAAHTETAVNAQGFPAFVDRDYTRPRVIEGPDNDFWDYLDWVLAEAERHGFYVALLPIWSNSITPDHPLARTPEVAYRYGHFLGSRYRKATHIIWTMGGDPFGKDRDVTHPAKLAMTRAMAEGITDGVNGIFAFDNRADWSTTLMTYHPKGQDHSSSETLHDEPWLDFNMIQTTTKFDFANYETIARDWAKSPPKPTLDAEVAYEDSFSLNRREPRNLRTTDWEVRRAAYWAVFAGGFGHTYGHRNLIAWTRAGETNANGANASWAVSLERPGARQMIHLKRLVESRPFLSRMPDQSLIVGDPGEGRHHARATRGEGYAFVYLPSGDPVTVRLDRFGTARMLARWFDPRTGQFHPIGQFPARASRRFAPPSNGAHNDWVLVLDALTPRQRP